MSNDPSVWMLMSLRMMTGRWWVERSNAKIARSGQEMAATGGRVNGLA